MYKVLTYTGDHHISGWSDAIYCIATNATHIIHDSYGLKLAMLMGMGNTMVESCSVEMPVRVWR